MTNRFRAALLIAVLTLSMLTGCAVHALGNPRAQQTGQTTLTTRDTPAALPPKQLTAEEATAIALEHAGFSADQVRYLRVEPELRDRVPHFDVEFEEGRWEYEYEIHAETGAILSFDKDD